MSSNARVVVSLFVVVACNGRGGEGDDGVTVSPLLANKLVQLRGVHGTTPFDNGGHPEADMFGYALALSGDGTRGVIGAYGENTVDPAVHDMNGTNNTAGRGAVRIYTRSGSAVVQEAFLIASDTYTFYGNFYTGEHFGKAVAIDGGGTRVLVGDPEDSELDYSGGSAWIYVRNGSTWTEEARLFTSTGRAFGSAVALTPDGTRAFVGAPQEPSPTYATRGNVYVYVRTGTTWTLEARLVGATDGSNLGAALAVTGDGATLFVDDLYALGGTGMTRIYQRTGTTWTETTPLLAPTPSMQTDRFGSALAVTPDGSRLLVGAYGRDAGPPGAGFYPGGAFVYVSTPTGWSLESAFSAPATGNQFFGDSLAIDATGARVLIGYGQGQGGGWLARLYVREGASWSQGTPIRTTELAEGGHGRSPVALSGDGTLAMLGAAETTADTQLCGPSHSYYCRIGSFANVYALEPGTAGTGCSLGSECASGYCADGVCCDTACGDGADDCQACSIAAGGTVDGTCTPLAAAVAPTRICRPGVDVCDVPEACSPQLATCPPDGFLDGSSICRDGHGVCDPEERCDGSHAACPENQFAPPGTVCRPATSACDVPESCIAGTVFCADDVTTCVVDAGVDAAGGTVDARTGGGLDAGGSGDAGTGSGGGTGSGCSVAQGTSANALVLVAALLARRRRRRRTSVTA